MEKDAESPAFVLMTRPWQVRQKAEANPGLVPYEFVVSTRLISSPMRM